MPVIKPTWRTRQRYILFEAECEAPVYEADVKNAAYAAMLSFLGEYGWSLANPKLMRYDAAKKAGIMRCEHRETEKVKAALALCTSINGKKAALRLRKTSGTIAGLRRRAVR